MTLIKADTPTDMWRSSPEVWEAPHPCEITDCSGSGTRIIENGRGEERTICDTHAAQYLVGGMN